jgi:hypothetical protein
MHCCRNILGTLVAGLAVMSASAQQRQPAADGSAQGILTVTATVVTSAGIVFGPDGESRIIVANAVDPRDNMSRLQQESARYNSSGAGPSPSHPAHGNSKRPKPRSGSG